MLENESESAETHAPAAATAATQPPQSPQSSTPEPAPPAGFQDLPLRDEVQQAVQLAGYTTPTPVQSQIIPHMLAGRDVLAQSHTGTGKTAAFALPILSRIDVDQRQAQVLILTPTRELAIQVAKSFSTYAACLDGLNVATIYGGQSYDPQLRQLRRGSQIVVGTPGRIIDHINRGTLDLSGIRVLVLDEADEMLNMGFLEDVQFVLEKTPPGGQIALFSATLPGPIQSIAAQYLNDPVKIAVKKKTMTADSIRQRALIVSPRDKVHALCRFLESEETDGVIVFTKTKAATLSLADSLCQEKLSAVAFNGDMPQATRERTVDQFKAGRLDILVATDVAARGLDVSRVSHVFNFDLPQDAESYTHRVGRTGRAGRKGEAIIFLTHAQRGKLRSIENVTRQRIEIVPLPTTKQINALRIKRFKQRISEVTTANDLTMFREVIAAHAEESGESLETIAAALACIGQQGRSLLAKDRPAREPRERREGQQGKRFERGGKDDGSQRSRSEGHRKPRQVGAPQPGKERYRLAVGHRDGVQPRHIVGAIANESGLEGAFIGPIQIHDGYSTVDLPEGMPASILQSLRRTRVMGKKSQLALVTETNDEASVQARTPNDHRPSKPNGKQVRAGSFAARKSNAGGPAKPFGKAKKRKGFPAKHAK